MWKLNGSKLTLRGRYARQAKKKIYRHAEKHNTMMGTGLRTKHKWQRDVIGHWALHRENLSLSVNKT